MKVLIQLGGKSTPKHPPAPQGTLGVVNCKAHEKGLWWRPFSCTAQPRQVMAQSKLGNLPPPLFGHKVPASNFKLAGQPCVAPDMPVFESILPTEAPPTSPHTLWGPSWNVKPYKSAKAGFG